MGPELWLLIGAVGVAGCLGLGFWAGYLVGGSPVDVLELQLAGTLARIDALLEQDDADHKAARAVIAVERELASVASLGAAARARLWLRSGPNDRAAPPAAGGTPSPAGSGGPESMDPTG